MNSPGEPRLTSGFQRVLSGERRFDLAYSSVTITPVNTANIEVRNKCRSIMLTEIQRIMTIPTWKLSAPTATR